MPNVPDSQTEGQGEYGTLQATGKQDWSCFYFLPYPFLSGDASKETKLRSSDYCTDMALER